MPKQKRTDDTMGKELNEELNFLNEDNEESTEEGSTQYYSFGMITYSVDVDITLFLECGVVVNYAYILHNNDKRADGSPMPPHYHIIFTTKQRHSCLSLVNIFNEITEGTQNTFCRAIKYSSFQAYLYLTHKTKRAIEQRKFQYNDSDIVSNNHSRWTRSKASADELTIEDFLADLTSRTFSVEHMCRKYGRDFMRNIKSYMESRAYILDERKENN